MFPLTLASCCSEEKPSPNTVLARLSAHWPNFCDVLVNVMLGVMVLLMITCWRKTTIMLGITLLNQCRWGDFQWSFENRSSFSRDGAAFTRWTVLQIYQRTILYCNSIHTRVNLWCRPWCLTACPHWRVWLQLAYLWCFSEDDSLHKKSQILVWEPRRCNKKPFCIQSGL